MHAPGALSAGGGRLTPRGEAVALSRDELNTRLRPGVRLLVTFAADPGFYHERIVGGEAFKGDVFIATSGGREYFESVSWWKQAWLVTGASRYPSDL